MTPMSLEALEANAIGFLANMPSRNGEDVRRVLKAMLDLRPDLSKAINDEQREQAAKRIEARLVIGMSDSAKIQLPFQQWFSQLMCEKEVFSFPTTRQWLKVKRF